MHLVMSCFILDSKTVGMQFGVIMKRCLSLVWENKSFSNFEGGWMHSWISKWMTLFSRNNFCFAFSFQFWVWMDDSCVRGLIVLYVFVLWKDFCGFLSKIRELGTFITTISKYEENFLSRVLWTENPSDKTPVH